MAAQVSKSSGRSTANRADPEVVSGEHDTLDDCADDAPASSDRQPDCVPWGEETLVLP